MDELINLHHTDLINFWTEHAPDGFPGMDKMPYFGQAQRPQFEQLDVVFLGINPSFHEEMLFEHWAVVHPTVDARALAVAPWGWCPNRSAEELDRLRLQLVELDQYSRQNFPRFFRPLEKVATAAAIAAGMNQVRWHALDMLPVRASLQQELAPHLPVGGEWHVLAENMFQRSIQLLIAMRPRVVVVANALVANLLIEKLEMQPQGNGHRYESARLPNVPFLLSGMLSYGVTDRFSKDRLTADLGNALLGGHGLQLNVNGRPEIRLHG